VSGLQGSGAGLVQLGLALFNLVEIDIGLDFEEERSFLDALALFDGEFNNFSRYIGGYGHIGFRLDFACCGDNVHNLFSCGRFNRNLNGFFPENEE